MASIKKIIEKPEYAGMETMVFSYIICKGIENLASVTEESIKKIDGNGFFSAEYLQSVVSCAVNICKDCSAKDIMEYIRLHLSFAPAVHTVDLYRRDFASEEKFNEILQCLDLEEEQVGESFSIYAVVDEESLQEV